MLITMQIYRKRESYIWRTKLPLIWNIDFQRVKGFNFSDIFQNFSNMSLSLSFELPGVLKNAVFRLEGTLEHP